MNKSDKWMMLHSILRVLEEELNARKEYIAHVDNEETKEFHARVIERSEREIEGVKQWMEEYKYERK